MNRSDLRTLLRDLVDEPYPGYYTNETLNRFINRAYENLAMEIHQRFGDYYVKTGSVSSAANVATVALPSDCIGRIKRIYDSDGVDIAPCDQREQDPTETGTPCYFSIRGQTILFFPIPDSIKAYTLIYYYLPAIFTNETTEADFPNGFHQLIAWDAALTGLIKSGDDAGLLLRKFSEMKANMFKSIQLRQTYDVRHARGGLGSNSIFED